MPNYCQKIGGSEIITGNRVNLHDWGFVDRQSPNRHLFAIETQGAYIGNCTHGSETNEEVELGIQIYHDEYIGKGYGRDAITAMVNYLFNQKNIKRIWVKVKNIKVQKFFTDCGFTTCGYLVYDESCFVLMELMK